MNTDEALDMLLESAYNLAEEVKRLRVENAKLTAVKNRKKLTAGEVARMRDMYRTGNYTITELAEIFDVHHATVGRTVRGVYWR